MTCPVVDEFVTRADLPANASPSRGGSAKPSDSAGVSQVVFDAHAIHFRVEPLRGEVCSYTEVVHDEVLESRLFRAAVGLAAVGAFAVAPVAAHAGNTDADGTLTSGGLALATPAIGTFSVPLTGLTQVVPAQVGVWSVTDATGSNAGYSVTVAASTPTVNGIVADAGTDPTLQLHPTTATPATNNPATTGPVPAPGQTLTPTPSTIDNAAAGTGQGEWDFAADTGDTANLAIVIPGNASAGAYSSTLTFTTSPPGS
jgi:hypothetical protein